MILSILSIHTIFSTKPERLNRTQQMALFNQSGADHKKEKGPVATELTRLSPDHPLFDNGV